MKNNLRNLIITNFLSAINFIYLSYLHYSTKFGFGSNQSLCNVNKTFNCDTVAISEYSQVFDIPISQLGLFFSLTVALIALMTSFRLALPLERYQRYLTWLSAIGVIASISMATISIFKLGTYCLFCIAAYILSFASLFFAIRENKNNSLQANFKEDLISLFTVHRMTAVTIILVPAFGYLAHSMTMTSLGFNQLNLIISESVESWKASPSKVFNQENGIVYTQSANPHITIVEFADFLCSHCKMAQKPLHQFVDSRNGIQLVYKPFPLDGNCNAAIQMKGDNIRCELSYAALCSEEIGKKGSLATDYIFERQMEWNRSTFDNDIQKMATALDIDLQQLKDCMTSSATHDKTLNSAKEAGQIMGTPTVFLNGKELPKGQLIPVLDAAIKSIKD